MAVINDPTTAANIQRVGMASGMIWTPSHVVAGPMPVGAGGAYRLSMQSGTIAAGLAASAELFQFRFVTAASRVALVHGVTVSAGANVAATAAGLQALRLTIARGWSAAGSGGTRATFAANQNKLRTAHASSEVNDAGIATTAALTAGTKTLDTIDIGSISFGVLTGAITTAVSGIIVPRTNLLGEFTGGMASALVLANQEGFVIRNGANAFAATMTWSLSVEVAWSEVDGF